MKSIVLSGLCTGALLFAVGCSSTPSYRTTSTYSPDRYPYVDSRTIGANVKNALWQDPTVNGFDINVDALRSTVQLTGTVDTLEQKRQAERVALAVPGVNRVENHLAVRTPLVGAFGAPVTREVGVVVEDPAMLLNRFVGSPDLYYGKAVDVQGTVDSILSPNSFTVSSPGFREKPVLVLTTQRDVRDVSPGDVVRIRGEAEPFNRSAAALRLNAELEPRKFDEWVNRASILADSIRRIKD